MPLQALAFGRAFLNYTYAVSVNRLVQQRLVVDLRGEVYDTRKYSYPGLLYLSTFTDVSNFFQGPPPGLPVGWHERLQAPPERGRTAWSQRLQIWAMHLSLPLALAAVAGTLTV